MWLLDDEVYVRVCGCVVLSQCPDIQKDLCLSI